MLFIEYYRHIYDTFSYLKGCILRICIIYFGLLSVKAPGFRQAF
jgi:hypothetical protein